MKIIGIDPGTARLGYGVIEVLGGKGSEDDKGSKGSRGCRDLPDGRQGIKYVVAGCLETKVETPMHERLLFLYEEMNKILKVYKPDVLAVESLFFGINAKTAIAVGQARGVILLAAAYNEVKTVVEYQGLSVKFAVTGFGRSKKKEIQEGVRKILKMKEIVKPDDAADGLAIAITHYIKTNSKPQALSSKTNKKPISKSKKPKSN